MMNVFCAFKIVAILDSFLNRLLKLLKNSLAIERTENSLEIVLLALPMANSFWWRVYIGNLILPYYQVTVNKQ